MDYLKSAYSLALWASLVLIGQDISNVAVLSELGTTIFPKTVFIKIHDQAASVPFNYNSWIRPFFRNMPQMALLSLNWNDPGFEDGLNGAMYSGNCYWDIQRTGIETGEFLIKRVEDKEGSHSGNKFCYMSLPKSASAEHVDHITIGQTIYMEANKIYEASVWVKWVNTRNGSESACISFWAQHQGDKTFAGKDVWIRNGDWTKLTFRFQAVLPKQPVMIYLSLLQHQTPVTTDIKVDDFNVTEIETSYGTDTRSGELISDGTFSRQRIGQNPGNPWTFHTPVKELTALIDSCGKNRYVRLQIPASTSNYEAVKLGQVVKLRKGVLYDVNARIKWTNYTGGDETGTVNCGIYHKPSNTWWGPVDYKVSDGEWHNVSFIHGACYSGDYELYVQVFGWGNFGNPMDISFDDFSITVRKNQ